MPHTIVTDICEGISDCASACPVGCIKPGKPMVSWENGIEIQKNPSYYSFQHF